MKHYEVASILTSRGIPFIYLNRMCYVAPDCYIIPGGIIKVYGSKFSGHQSAIRHIADYMYNCLTILPVGEKIWLVVTGKYNQSAINDITGMSDCIKHVASLDDIVIGDYIIPCSRQEYLRTICSTHNKNYDRDVATYKGKIVTSDNIYKKSVCNMTDEEIERLDKFDLIVLPDIEYELYIKNRKTAVFDTKIKYKDHRISPDYDIFNDILVIQKSIVSLNGDTHTVRSICRLFDGVTIQCPLCTNMIYIDALTRHHNKYHSTD